MLKQQRNNLATIEGLLKFKQQHKYNKLEIDTNYETNSNTLYTNIHNFYII